MRNNLRWLFSIIFGIAIIGCQDDVTVNNPENSSGRINKTSLLSGKLGDRVWNDLNKNGIQDVDETGIEGLPVGLLNCTDNSFQLTHTDVNGNYFFNNLPVGSYKVKFQTPVGWIFSKADQTTDELDSDVLDPFTDGPSGTMEGFTSCFTFSGVQNDLSWDAGVYQPSTHSGNLGNFVWNDLDRDGIQDIGEPGIPGLKVSLYDCYKKFIKETTTDAHGNYFFSDLPTGEYRIKFDLPEGWIFTTHGRLKFKSEDSDAHKDGFTQCIKYTLGTEDLIWDAGLYQSKKVHPRAYGYWKTHSMYGPAKYDPTWALIGEDTPFFDSNKTWFGVINTNPKKGNVYYILAHQYIAARLNELAGVIVPHKVTAALFRATALFDNPENTPKQLEKLKGNASLRKEFLKLSKLLHKFNDGKKKHGHFDHD